MVVNQHRPAHFGRGTLLEVTLMQLDWEKYRSDFRKLVDGFVRALGKFVKVEKVEFDESISSNYQDATITYFNRRVKEVHIHAFADQLPDNLELILCKLFWSAGVDWWCYRNNHSRNITVYNTKNIFSTNKVLVGIYGIPIYWAEIDKGVVAEVLKPEGAKKKLIFRDEISIFDIFDFIVAAFTLTQL
jgi:hypothetical protein